MTVPGFPNMFVIYGPNTNHGHRLGRSTCSRRRPATSREALRLLAGGAADRLEVRQDVHDGVPGASSPSGCSRTVWTTGCGSWYVNDAGRVTATGPACRASTLRRTARLEVADFQARSARRPPRRV